MQKYDMKKKQVPKHMQGCGNLRPISKKSKAIEIWRENLSYAKTHLGEHTLINGQFLLYCEHCGSIYKWVEPTRQIPVQTCGQDHYLLRPIRKGDSYWKIIEGQIVWEICQANHIDNTEL